MFTDSRIDVNGVLIDGVVVETERKDKIVKLTEAKVTYVAVKLDGDERKPVPIRGA